MKVESVQTTLYKLFSEYKCPKPMATTNVSSCVGSSSHTSSAVDDPDDHEDKEDNLISVTNLALSFGILHLLPVIEIDRAIVRDTHHSLVSNSSLHSPPPSKKQWRRDPDTRTIIPFP
ncbi:hypothetical protein CMV_011592 [Castanea mollissima]|uniref:Uncharacterized protein n=1 Tax=Castanea mollissima TaxID=60419 RepID=A0A8J4RKL2_9ROSI|nr:hypothetical protein CMV_011592 [Castanea mollissima]